MGSAHTPEVTIASCWECHAVLNERQADAGMVRDHSVERSDQETAYAFDAGLSGALSLLALHHPALGPEVAASEDLFAARMGRVLDVVGRAAGEPAIGGPEPRRNDLRRAGRRGRREDRSQPRHSTGIAGPAGDRERMVEIASAVGGAVAALPQAEQLGQWGRDVQHTTDHAAELYDRNEWLESIGRGEDLAAVCAHGSHIQRAYEKAVAPIDQVEEYVEAVPDHRRVMMFSERWMAFLLDLLDAGTPADAGVVLDKHLPALLGT
jgi:hypothetical protein